MSRLIRGKDVSGKLVLENDPRTLTLKIDLPNEASFMEKQLRNINTATCEEQTLQMDFSVTSVIQ